MATTNLQTPVPTRSRRTLVAMIAVGMVSAIASVLGTVVTAAPASAITTYKVTEISRSGGMVNMNNMLAQCSGTPGFVCVIERSISATREISLSLGVSRGTVAGALNISSATTRTVAVSCKATITSNRPVLKAYPMGTQIFYKVTRNQNGDKKTSGTLMAFVPDGASTFCTHLRG